MNRPLLTTLALLATLCFGACNRDAKTAGGEDKPGARDQKTAIEEFKKDFLAVKAWAADKKKGPDADSPAAMKEMISKIKGIKTDGLPADLKDAWNAQVGDMDVMAEALTAPEPTDPAKKAEMEKKMGDLFPKMEEHTKKLDEVGKKYGIEGMDKLG